MSPHLLRARQRAGFALIIVVALLALLVLVLVSLATLTRIEANVGTNSRKHAQARQNAMFALDQAMAELQRHAGADTRVTAAADLTSATLAPGVRYWTSVWGSSDTGYRAWLISGTENIASPVPLAVGSLAVSPALNDPQNPLADLLLTGGAGDVPCQLLAGSKTLGSNEAGYIVAPLVPLEGPAPDGSGTVVSGRYAWWVADEGVKASLALRDRIDEVDYANSPYATAAQRARLRQQVPVAHQGYRSTDGSGSPKQGFDPALAANETNLRNVIARNQIPFLTAASGTSLLTSTRNLFHEWTTVASGVLVSTNPAHPGLKRDLSRTLGLLGTNFATWAGGANMETPAVGNSASPAITTSDDVRRRYPLQSPVPASPHPGDICVSAAPVLADFVIQFGIKRPSSDSSSVDVRARLCVSVWNPYTSALIPEDLRLVISGLPTVTLSSSGGGATVPLDLQSSFASMVGAGGEVHLDWSDSTSDSAADFASWLPGRVYYWRTDNGVASPDLLRYRKRIASSAGWLTSTNIALSEGGITISRTDPTSLVVALRTVDGTTLATTSGFAMPGGWTTPGAAFDDDPTDEEYWLFGFGFRLAQPTTAASSSWLSTLGSDPRNAIIQPGQTMSYNPNGTALLPINYAGSINTEWNATIAAASPGALLNRDTATGPFLSFNNDTPVFELPRSPILSLGMLQHLRVHGARPFAIGNSWGAPLVVPGVDGGGTIGSWWDRFYFSGLASDTWGPDLPGGEPLPWYHLRPIDTRIDPTAPLNVTDIRNASPHTSRFLLMDGAFNVNSTGVDAWEAVLRSLRFTAPDQWTVADLEVSGINGGSVSSGSGVAQTVEDLTQGPAATMTAGTSGFLRFSQSAQEVFETTGSVSGFDRSRFRQGIRGGSAGPTGRSLTSIQMRALATAIVARLREKVAASGLPFLTMEEFLSPTVIWTGRSLLEQAIVDANLNSGVPDFCSYTLTQADILTAIGPFLQCRSDTFLIRTYGESLNPVTGEVESRAWCEATVQRIPTRVDGGNITEGATGFGRRFVITSFRWLSPDDI